MTVRMKNRQFQISDSWIPIIISVITIIATAGFTYGQVKSDVEQMKEKSKHRDEDVEYIKMQLSRTDRNIVRIGQALKIEVELPNR